MNLRKSQINQLFLHRMNHFPINICSIIFKLQDLISLISNFDIIEVIATINILMIKSNRLPSDSQAKDVVKDKIKQQIEKMRNAEAKGDTEAMEKIMILQERLRLIESYREFDQNRITNMQKLFKHYCTHVFKTGRNINFDRIGYENQHLTMERYFVMVKDFKLNEIPLDDEIKQLTDRNNIILLFKKCSSNARNLEFPQFITSLQRLFVLLFNQTENYDRRQQQILAEKKKRAENAKKKQALIKGKAIIKEKRKNGIDENQQEESQQDDEEDEEQPTKNVSALKTQPAQNIQPLPQANLSAPAQPAQPAQPNQPAQPAQLSKPNIPVKQGQVSQASQQPIKPNKQTGNDEMVKQMMKDFQIVNPTDQVKKAVKKVKRKKKQDESEEEQYQIQQKFNPYGITDEEKIESYMLRIGIDDYKLIQKKFRYFEKANVKYNQQSLLQRARLKEAKELEKSKLTRKNSLKHDEIVELHEEWDKERKAAEQNNSKRLLSLRQKINERQMQKSKGHISESLPKDTYVKKKKRFVESFEKRQRELMDPFAIARLTKRKQQEEDNTQYFSLQMIHKSTPNQLPMGKINPERYIALDPSDSVFMEEYNNDSMRSMRGRQSQAELVEATKRRASQIENQQAKRMSRFTMNMYKNHHYLEKFLQRKW